ncbi:MAG TPA: carboxymuconolactone decarboxylase family protein [Thermoanaerobaculia bacterium]|nr:carboxymuconolactone decarboxylase family protein [Thermoanaerobaculia bacterium]
MTNSVEALRSTIPDVAKDIKLNLQSVLQPGALTPAQRWGVAIASAVAARNASLRDALIADAGAEVGAEVADNVVDDAVAAAALMAMNNVYYRFRHLVGKPSYSQMPARLRMQRIAKPLTNKADFELFCLAVSAINGCEMCIRSHEEVVLKGGLSEEQVHDAVRVAATVNAAALSLELPVLTPVAV